VAAVAVLTTTIPTQMEETEVAAVAVVGIAARHHALGVLEPQVKDSLEATVAVRGQVITLEEGEEHLLLGAMAVEAFLEMVVLEGQRLLVERVLRMRAAVAAVLKVPPLVLAVLAVEVLEVPIWVGGTIQRQTVQQIVAVAAVEWR